MTSIVFTQFEDDLPVDVNKEYYISCYTRDTRLQEIHKLCLFPEKLREYLLQFKFDEKDISKVNSQTNLFKYTPLMIAIDNNIIESIKLLLKYNSNVNIQNIFNNTALMISYNNIEIAKLLLEYGADVNIKNNYGDTTLIRACYNNIKITKLLLEYDADINIKNKYNSTALSMVCFYKNIDCIKLLLQYSSDYLEYNEYFSKIIITTIIITTHTIISNINNLSSKRRKIYTLKLNKFDYNSILLYELTRCVFSQAKLGS